MELRQLRYFLSIAESESFSRAAAVLRVAQPALTRQIQQLEAELGVQLFLRNARGVRLTAAGELLQERAGATLQQLEQARREVAATAVSPVGRLHLGMPSSLRSLVTRPLVTTFGNECPSVFLKLTEGTSMVLNDATLAEELDLAVVASIEPDITTLPIPLVQEQLFLVGPKGAGLSRDKPVELSMLNGMPLILASRPDSTRMIVENAMKRRGMDLRVIMETACFQTVAGMVSEGGGWSVVPFSSCANDLRDGLVRGAPIRNLFVRWTIVQPRHRAMPVAAVRMRELLQQTVSSALQDGTWEHAYCLLPPDQGGRCQVHSAPVTRLIPRAGMQPGLAPLNRATA